MKKIILIALMATSNIAFCQCLSGNCVNGFGKKNYDNGSSYEGNFVNGNKEGNGTFTSKYGMVYTGKFAKDLPNGRGKAKYENEDMYDGDWVDGKIEGQGTLTYKNGNYYIGAFKNDKQNGYGKEYDKAGNMLKEGTWKDDVFVNAASGDMPTPTTSTGCVSGNCINGFGKFIYEWGVYEGDWVSGKMKGKGTWTLKTGEVYVGQFDNGDFNGKGKMGYSKGNIYEGDFVNGVREGQGTFNYKNGNYYTGEFKNNVRNGFGKFYNKETNTTQEGIWKDGVFVNAASGDTPTPTTSTGCVSGNCINGFGKFIYEWGAYEGDWVDGKMKGKGTWTLKSGEVYVGQFDKDNFNGKGKMKYKNGNIYEGDFVNGVKEGLGTYNYTNGNYYTGEFKNDLQNGTGKFYNKATNTTQKGIWKNGVFVKY